MATSSKTSSGARAAAATPPTIARKRSVRPPAKGPAATRKAAAGKATKLHRVPPRVSGAGALVAGQNRLLQAVDRVSLKNQIGRAHV